MRITVQLIGDNGAYRTETFEMSRVPTVGEVLCFDGDAADTHRVEFEPVTVVQVRNWIGRAEGHHWVELLTMPKRTVDLANARARGILPL
jgi:hypothetical protein